MAVPDTNTFSLQDVVDTLLLPERANVLYNAYVAITNILIAGLVVPTENDFNTLSTYVGGVNIAGGKLKVVDTRKWEPPNTGATNNYNFTARPSGYRSGDVFLYKKLHAFYWSKTEGIQTHEYVVMRLNYNNVLFQKDGQNRVLGLTIRCMRALTGAEQSSYSDGDTVAQYTDYNGNKYNLVKIGEQGWLSSNVIATHYSDGTAISLVPGTPSGVWGAATYPAMCYYDDVIISTDSLQGAFDKAIDEYFDPAYVNNKDDQYEFRNYGGHNIPTLSVTPTGANHAWRAASTNFTVTVTPSGTPWSIIMSPPSWAIIENVTQTGFRLRSVDNTGYDHGLDDMIIGLTNHQDIQAHLVVSKQGKLGIGLTNPINIVNSSFIWQWDASAAPTKSTTYLPTSAVCEITGDTNWFTVNSSSNGSISVTTRHHNSYPGARKELWIRVTKLGYEDAVLHCTHYEQVP